MKETKTPQQILDQAREEFKKFKCIQNDCDGNGCIPNQVAEDEWEAQQCQFHAEYLFPILSWHTTTLKAFIEAEIARLEEMEKKSYYGCITHRGLNRADCIVCAEANIENNKQKSFNQAIDDQITHLKQITL